MLTKKMKVVPLVISTVVAACAAPAPVADSGVTPQSLTCTDDAGTWCRPTITVNEPINRVWGTSGTDLWFVGDKGTVVRYFQADAGQPMAWSKITTATTYNLYSIWGSSAKDVWIAGAGPTYTATTVFHYVQGAIPAWVPISSTTTKMDINALWGFGDGATINYAGCSATAGSFASNGSGWKTEILPPDVHAQAAWAASAEDQWIVGRTQNGIGISGPRGADSAQGRILRKQANGAWSETNGTGLAILAQELEANLATGMWFTDIHGTSATDIWAVGTKGLVAHFDGTQWTQLIPEKVDGANLYGVWPVSPTEVWMSGGVLGNGTTADVTKLIKYTNVDGVANWEAIEPPANAGVFYRLWIDKTTKVVWVGGTKGIFRYKP